MRMALWFICLCLYVMTVRSAAGLPTETLVVVILTVLVSAVGAALVSDWGHSKKGR